MQIFLYRNKILNKDYKAWISSKSVAIIADAEEYTKQQYATDIQYLASCHNGKAKMWHYFKPLQIRNTMLRLLQTNIYKTFLVYHHGQTGLLVEAYPGGLATTFVY